jgi:1-acyl-sn-glycerol-3-phosphate acyltransferase
MSFVMGVLRSAVAFVVVLFSTLVILLFTLIPIEMRGVRLASWICCWVARLAMTIFGFDFKCDAPEKLSKHRGIVMVNHITLWDILALMSVFPMRFLSAEENRKLPLIGWVAQAIGTVFVNRKDKSSRQLARQQIAAAPKYPPIVLFPEGGIGEANKLRPFRYGAFEICAENETPFLPCVIRYSKGDEVQWLEGESFYSVFWRIASHVGTIRIELIPLDVVPTKKSDDAAILAAATHRNMARVLGAEPVM